MNTILLMDLHKVDVAFSFSGFSKRRKMVNQLTRRINKTPFSKFVKAFLFILVSIFITSTSVAQVQFSAVCPNKKIGKNDLVEIQFKVENASHVENIIPPSFKDFNIVSGPNQQRSMSSINGRVSQYVSIGFSLQPKHPGKSTIGSATAQADGKEYKSEPVTITVTKDASLVQNNTARPSPFPNFNFDLPDVRVRHRFNDYILKPGENAADKKKKNLSYFPY